MTENDFIHHVSGAIVKYDLTHLAMVGPDGVPVFLIPSATPDHKLNERRKQERAQIVHAANSFDGMIRDNKLLAVQNMDLMKQKEALLSTLKAMVKEIETAESMDCFITYEEAEKVIAQAEARS